MLFLQSKECTPKGRDFEIDGLVKSREIPFRHSGETRNNEIGTFYDAIKYNKLIFFSFNCKYSLNIKIPLRIEFALTFEHYQYFNIDD